LSISDSWKLTFLKKSRSQNHIIWFCGLETQNQHQQKNVNDTMVFYDLHATFVIERSTHGNGSFSNEVSTKTQGGLTDEHRRQVWKKTQGFLYWNIKIQGKPWLITQRVSYSLAFGFLGKKICTAKKIQSVTFTRENGTPIYLSKLTKHRSV